MRYMRSLGMLLVIVTGMLTLASCTIGEAGVSSTTATTTATSSFASSSSSASTSSTAPTSTSTTEYIPNLPSAEYPESFADPTVEVITGELTTLPEPPPDYAIPTGLKVLDVSVSQQLLGSGDKTWTVISTDDGEADAVYWRTPAANQQMYCPNIAINDFSEYSSVEFWMYSQKATGATCSLLFYGVGDLSYFRCGLSINWSGWKKVKLSLSDMDSVRDCKWTLINSIRLNSSGWDCTLVKDKGENILYIGDMYLTKDTSDYQVDPDDIDQNDLDQIKAQWKELLVGNFIINNHSGAATSQIRMAAQRGKSNADTMNMGQGITCLWNDLTDFKTHGGNIQTTYERLLNMAVAWGAWGSEYYHDPSLLSQIKFGLKWMSENVYNESSVEQGNWWQWEIGAPLALSRTVLIIEDELTAAEIKFDLRGLDYFSPLPKQTYANRAWFAYSTILSALCQDDAERIIKSVSMLMNVFTVSTTGDGFYADGGFIQHNAMPYMAGYGGTYFSFMADIFFVLRDSKLSINESYLNSFADQFFDSSMAFMIDGTFACTLMGRTVTHGDGSARAAGQCISMLKVIPMLSAEDRERFYSTVLGFYRNNADFAIAMASGVGFFDLKLYDEMTALLTEGKVIPSDVPNFAKVYGSMDRAFQKSDNYFAALAMSSARIYRYEAINGENGSGWYQGDGALFVYTGNSKLTNDYFRTLNPYMLPGTTVTDARRTVMNIALGQNIPGAYTFVGGVSSGLSAVAAMHLAGLSEKDAAKVDNVSSTLDVYKGWFMFGDAIVCADAALNCSDAGRNALTVIDQRPLPADASMAKITVDGQVFVPSDTATEVTADYITMGSFGGYYFPEADSKVTIGKHGTATVQMYHNYGQNVKNGSFVYVMLPGMTEAEVAAYAADPRIEVSENTSRVMAVREKTTGECGYIFWEKGVYGNIAVSAPCVILTTEHADGSVTYSVSEPTQNLVKVIVNVLGEYEVVEADSRASGVQMEGFISLSFDFNYAQGATASITLMPASR